jgi:hypothetical protein
MFLKVLRLDTVDVGECDLEEELIKVFKFTANHCLLIIVNGIIYVPTMTSIDSLNPCVAVINKQYHIVKAQQVPYVRLLQRTQQEKLKLVILYPPKSTGTTSAHINVRDSPNL